MATLRLQKLWWLHPAWLFASVIGLTVLAAAAQSEAAYQLYRTPKYLETQHVAIAGMAILFFVLGCKGGESTGRIPSSSTISVGLVRTSFRIAVLLTLFGYAVWFVMGLQQGLSLALLKGFFSIQDDSASAQLGQDVFQRIPGITTCTQFGPAAVLLGIWLHLHGERGVRWPLALHHHLGCLPCAIHQRAFGPDRVDRSHGHCPAAGANAGPASHTTGPMGNASGAGCGPGRTAAAIWRV